LPSKNKKSRQPLSATTAGIPSPSLSIPEEKGEQRARRPKQKKRHPTGGFLSARTPAGPFPFPFRPPAPPPLRLLLPVGQRVAARAARRRSGC